MSARKYLISQFKRPRGPLGRLAGWIMANRPSNRLRNTRTVDLLDLRFDDRVLEVGYGPGLALRLAAKRVSDGRIVGIDHSVAMRDQAKARNRAAVTDGRMRLFVGSVAELSQPSDSELDRPFDKIFGVNVALFWDDPVAVFRALKDRLTEDGVVAFTHQPRAGDKSDAAALAFAGRMEDAMIEGGLGKVRIKRLEDLSPIAVCVIGSGSRGEP